MTNSLPVGNYMRKADLIEALEYKFDSYALSIEIMNNCSPEVVEGTAYYNTSGLKNLIPSGLYRQIECVVPTLMVTE